MRDRSDSEAEASSQSGDGTLSASRRDARARDPEQRLSIRLLQSLDVVFSRIYHRLEVHSPSHLPRHGPVILVSNHISGLDPVLIQSVSRRIIRWMMAKEFYDLKAMNWIFRTIEAIPVARSGRDMSATRAGLRVLKRGEVLGVFPEGRIELQRALMPFQTGVALMAIHSGAPVYPVYLDGTQRENPSMLKAYLKPNRAVVAFGPPVEFDRGDTEKETLIAATEKIQAAVQALMNEVVASECVAIRVTRPERRAALLALRKAQAPAATAVPPVR